MGKQLKFWAAAITAIGFTLGLIGCSTGEGNPSATPTTAPPPVSQTFSPSPAPPSEEPPVETVRPDIDIPEPKKYPEMANDDLDGADTAARYFLELYGYVYNTGDLKAWKKISDPECEHCNFVTEEVESYYEKGHWFEKVEMLHGESLVYYPDEEFPHYLVLVEVLVKSYNHFDSDGTLLSTSPENIFPKYAIGIEYVGPNKWKVVGVADLGQDE